MSTVIVKHGRTSRLAAGHPWVYAGEIEAVRGEAQDGNTVDIRDSKGRFLGRGIFNTRSQIVVRRFTLGHEELDEDFLRSRITAALAWRQRALPELFDGAAAGVRPMERAAFRVVFSESDFLPGLIIDRYPGALVLQTLTLGMDLRKPLIAKVAAQILRCDAVIERNDVPVRKLEGMDAAIGWLSPAAASAAQKGGGQANAQAATLAQMHPEGPQSAGLPLSFPVTFAVNDVQMRVDLFAGQKTGVYLDQRQNYRAVAAHAAGRRVLDAFCYHGGFALHCAKAGAAHVDAVEISQEAVTAAVENAARNGVADRCQFIAANAFDTLKAMEAEGQSYELIVLDPPSFTRTKQQVESAVRGYKELNLRALKMLRSGGLLATFCCAHHVDAAMFKAVVLAAAADARRTLRLVQTLTQSPDHPVLPAVPETEYLKGFLLEVV